MSIDLYFSPAGFEPKKADPAPSVMSQSEQDYIQGAQLNMLSVNKRTSTEQVSSGFHGNTSCLLCLSVFDEINKVSDLKPALAIGPLPEELIGPEESADHR